MLRPYLWLQSCQNLKSRTSLLRPKTTLCFRRRFSDQVSTLQQRRFPDENLTVYHYHYNSLFPKTCKLSCNFILNKDNLFCLCQCKALVQFGIFLEICSSLPEQRKGIFDLAWFNDHKQVPIF